MYENLQILISQSEKLASLKEWNDKAIEINTKILEQDPYNTTACTRLARCFVVTNQLFAARSMYDYTLSIDPKNVIAINNLKLIEDDVAKLEIVDIIKEIRNYYEAFTVGIVANKNGQTAIAIQCLEKSLEFKRTKYALNALGAIYRTQCQFDTARKMYNEALEMEDNAVSKIGLAAILRDEKKLDDALNAYKEIMKLHGVSCHALNGLGGVYADLKKYTDAESCFVRALALDKERNDSIQNLKKLQDQYRNSGDDEGVNRINRIIEKFTDKPKPEVKKHEPPKRYLSLNI